MGSYYGTPFKGHRGVTQGDSLYHTIFNMVTDTVICHWVTMVAGEETGPGGFGQVIKWKVGLKSTPHWRKICMRLGWKRSIPTSPGARIKSRNTL